MPPYVLGLMGVTRRMRVFDDPSLQIWFIIAAFGAALIAAGIGAFIVQVGYSIWKRKELAVDGDPWGGRTLEWSTTSPPPAYNFAFTPVVHEIDAWDDMKRCGAPRPAGNFKAIHMPKNTEAGIVLGGIATVFGFAMIWHIWWLAGLTFAGLIGYAIFHTFNYNRDYYIPADEVTATEAAALGQLAPAGA
jgi:cytochrome o ubiquinol oxidase subunit 1